MKKLIIFLAVCMFTAMIANAQMLPELNYKFKKTLSADPDKTDYSVWKFPLGNLATDTIRFDNPRTIAVGINTAKNYPTWINVTIEYSDVSGDNIIDSVFFAGMMCQSETTLVPNEYDEEEIEFYIQNDKNSFSNTVDDKEGRFNTEQVRLYGFIRSFALVFVINPYSPNDQIVVRNIIVKTFIYPGYND